MNARRVVCVTWTDAHGNAFAVYEPHEIPHSPAIVNTYGVLLKEDEAGVSVANEIFEAGGFRGVTFIPRGMIRGMDDVIGTRPRKPKTQTAITPGG